MRVVHILFLDVAYVRVTQSRIMKIYFARAASLCRTDGPGISLRKYRVCQRCLLFPGELAVSKVVSGNRQLQFHFRAWGLHTRVLFPRRLRRWRRWYRPRRPIKNVSANGALRIRTQVEMWILTCPFAQREIDANHNDVKFKCLRTLLRAL